MTDITDALPCPFCGSTDLRVADWTDDSGDYDAIECNQCYGAAPARTWNSRSRDAAIEAALDGFSAVVAEDSAPPSWELVDVREAQP